MSAAQYQKMCGILGEGKFSESRHMIEQDYYYKWPRKNHASKRPDQGINNFYDGLICLSRTACTGLCRCTVYWNFLYDFVTAVALIVNLMFSI